MKAIYTLHFSKQLKKIRKKYPQIYEELLCFLEDISLEEATSIGKSCYKIRFSPKKSSKGKSGGMRIINLYLSMDELLVPICIYEKNQKENISKKELAFHLKTTHKELLH